MGKMHARLDQFLGYHRFVRQRALAAAILLRNVSQQKARRTGPAPCFRLRLIRVAIFLLFAEANRDSGHGPGCGFLRRVAQALQTRLK